MENSLSHSQSWWGQESRLVPRVLPGTGKMGKRDQRVHTFHNLKLHCNSSPSEDLSIQKLAGFFSFVASALCRVYGRTDDAVFRVLLLHQELPPLPFSRLAKSPPDRAHALAGTLKPVLKWLYVSHLPRGEGWTWHLVAVFSYHHHRHVPLSRAMNPYTRV